MLPLPVVFPTASYCSTSITKEVLVVPSRISAILEADSGTSESEQASALLEKAALGIAHATASPGTCAQVFAEGERLFLGVLVRYQKQHLRRGAYERSPDSALAVAQRELTRLWQDDQSARQAYVALRTDDRTSSVYWAQRLATAHTLRVDGKSASYLERLLKNYDWIDIDRFGASVSAHAWILIQHADRHPALQALALERMERYLGSGGIKPANYAFLWDRVAVNAGRKQRYGTQPTWECTEGQLKLQPLEDPDNVNQRRTTMHMGTVEAGLAEMAQGVCQ